MLAFHPIDLEKNKTHKDEKHMFACLKRAFSWDG